MTQIIVFSKYLFLFIFKRRSAESKTSFLSDNVWAHKGNKFCHYEPIPKWDKKFLTKIQLLKIQFTEMFYDHKP